MGVEAPEIEAKVLMLKATGLSEVQFFTSLEQPVSRSAEKKFLRLLNLRLQGLPLAYVIGEKEFWSLSFRTPPGVFIPRPETELIIEKVLELCAGNKRSTAGALNIVDIGTGAGNIAVALAKELPQAFIYATDNSARALRVAALNAQRHNVTNIRFVRGNLYSAISRLGLEKKCHFIVSNPPYVSEAEWPELPSPIRNHEPRRALVPGKTGLEFIRRLISGAPAYLQPGGYLVFEVGQGQAEKACQLFSDQKWSGVGTSADLMGIPRIVWGRTMISCLK